MGGTNPERIIVASLDLASIAAGATAVQELALPAGTCDPGDIVEVLGVDGLEQGIVIQGVLPVTVADRVRIRVSNMGGLQHVEQSIDLASVAANATADQDFALPAGTVGVNDHVLLIGTPALEHGLVVQGVLPVPAADTVRLRVSNLTAAAIDAAARTFHFLISRAIDPPARDFTLRVIRF